MKNAEQIARAASALQPYFDQGALASPVEDLLADLRHYCHRHGHDFEASLEMSKVHFEEEEK